MKIGVLVAFREDTDIPAKFKEVKTLGLDSCQVNIWNTDLT